MRFGGQRAPRRWIGLHRPALAVLGLFVAASVPAGAQEPLFVRIRPLPEPGSAEAARAAREALWARRQAHARTVIESVCTGCLGAWKPADPPPGPATVPVAAFAAPEGVESDPGSGASGPTPEQPTSERHP